MNFSFLFFFNSISLGIGLAMDAFSVSIANAISEPKMKSGRMAKIAGVYAFFQFAMPLLGWFCVVKIIEFFKVFEPFIPWVAFLLLLYIGGKMLIESIREIKASHTDSQDESLQAQASTRITIGVLIVQGIATSIDALSVGFTIADYGFIMAFVAALIIAIVTFFICVGGLKLGSKAGERLSGKAGILGGVILILIGIEILIKGIFF